MVVGMVVWGPAAVVEAQMQSQVWSGGVAPIQNAAAAGARSPGQMVSNSFSRLDANLAAPIRSFAGITQVYVPGVGEAFRSQASLVLVQQLTVAMDLFVQAWLTRAGLVDASTQPGSGRDPGGGRTPGGRKVQTPSR